MQKCRRQNEAGSAPHSLPLGEGAPVGTLGRMRGRGINGMVGFRPAGRVPFAAMQKEPKNRWETARIGLGLRPPPPLALPPVPITGVPRPCVGRTLQNLRGLTLPVCLGISARFTGDTLYPHHDRPQNLFPLRLTNVARRGRRWRCPEIQPSPGGRWHGEAVTDEGNVTGRGLRGQKPGRSGRAATASRGPTVGA